LAVIALLQAENTQLRNQIAELQKRIAELETALAKAKRNSTNSSKPPSSDIVKPPSDSGERGNGQRHIGAQPGHPKHQRPPFPPEAITQTHDYKLDKCPACGGPLVAGSDAPRVIQQVEIVATPVRIEEHRGLAGWCPHCQKIHYAPLPAEVEKGGLCGVRLTTLVAYMKGGCHASFSTIRKFLRDVVGITISRGQLRKVIGKVSAALAGPYEQLLQGLPLESRVNVDETGHKENGQPWWTWCFRAELYVLFRIDQSRGSQVLIDVLGKEFNGVLGCDYFSAYRKFMKDFDIMIQFCLAHLIRDVKFLLSLPDASTRAYGQRLLEELRGLFGIIHQKEHMSPEAFESALQNQRQCIIARAISDVPLQKEAQNMARRFVKHGEAYFRFITTPGVEPTNNIAEQAIRFIVMDRHITQGTRSESGRKWCERIWTVLATCAQQDVSPFTYLLNAVSAYFQGKPVPSLLTARASSP
jgi:transposase